MVLNPITRNAPALAKIQTIGEKTHYINSEMVIALSPSASENNTDVILLNGQIYTIKGTPEENAKNYNESICQTGKNINFKA